MARERVTNLFEALNLPANIEQQITHFSLGVGEAAITNYRYSGANIRAFEKKLAKNFSQYKYNENQTRTEIFDQIYQRLESSGLLDEMESFMQKNNNPQLENYVKQNLLNIIVTTAGACSIVDHQGREELDFVLNKAFEADLSNTLDTFKGALANPTIENFEKTISALAADQHQIASQVTRTLEALPLAKDTEKAPPQKATKEEGGRRYLSEFEFTGFKTKGIQTGIMAKKKVHEEMKGTAEETKEKYTYTWMIKKLSPESNIASKLTSSLNRFFLGDNAAKEKMLVSSDGKTTCTSSRFVDTFQNMQEAQTAQGLRPVSKREEFGDRYEQFYNEHPNALRVAAVNLYARNFDIHMENLGEITNTAGEKEAAVVDFDCGLQLYNGHHIFTTQSYNRLHPNEEKSAEELLSTRFSPIDFIHSIHKGHFHINSRIFLKEAFANELDWVVDEAERTPKGTNITALSSTMKSATNEIQSVHNSMATKRDLRLDNIAPGTTIDNLHENLMTELTACHAEMRELAFNIRLQLAILKEDFSKVQALVEERPEVLTKQVAWLSPYHTRDAPEACTPLEYAYQECFNQDLLAYLENAKAKGISAESQDKSSRTKPDMPQDVAEELAGIDLTKITVETDKQAKESKSFADKEKDRKGDKTTTKVQSFQESTSQKPSGDKGHSL